MLKSKHLTLHLIINGISCAVIGATFGSYGGLASWTISGLILGIFLALAWERLFIRYASKPRLYRYRLVLLILLEVILTIYLVMPAFASWNNVHPQRVAIPITPAEMDMDYEDIQLTASDGVQLAGWYIPSQNGAAIIALHGFNGNRTHVLPHTKILHDAGYGVLLFDMRTQGESGGETFHHGWGGALDVAPAIDFLQARPEIDDQRIGILGLSSGGITALNAAAELPSLKAIIADGVDANRTEDYFNPMPPEYKLVWFMTPIPWITDRGSELFSGIHNPPSMATLLKDIAPRQVLFIASGEGVEIFQGRKFASGSPGNVSLWELPEAAHCGGIFSRPEEYASIMLDFFDEYLK